MTPTVLPPSPRGPDCPPAATLEALSAGEDVPPQARAHADACPACSAQVEALRAEADAFLRARPTERFLRQLAARDAEAAGPRGLRRLFPALALAVPLAVAVAVLPRLVDSPGISMKGDGFRVAVARAAGGAPELVAADAVVHPGDALRFSYEADRDGHLLVLDLDGRGDASVLHPFGAATSAPLAAGQRDFLPGSVVLDDAPGPEVLVAVLSPRPLDAAPLLEALRRQAGRADPTVSCDGCRITALRLQKRP
jgi:hypothetical protein